MGLSPWTRDDREPVWTFGLQPDSSPFDVSELSLDDFSLVLVNTDTLQEIIGTGVFTSLITATGTEPERAAKVVYNPSGNDVGTIGKFDLRVVCKKGTPNQRTFRYGPWEVER